MNEIQRLIHKMCPDGVPVGTLGELCTLKARIGWQGLTKKEYRENGDYLLVTGTDFTPDYKIDFNHCVYVDKERYDQDPYIQLKDQDVLITKDGTLGKMAYIDHLPKPTTLNGGVFVIRDKSGKLNQKYMMYYMTSNAFKNMIDKNHTSGSIMHLTQKLLVNFQIPLPPLPIQQRIVEILDKFTSLVSSLDSEIALRQKQNEYYRNKLLSFEEGDEGVEWKTLNDCSVNVCSGGTPSRSKSDYFEGNIPWLRTQEVDWKDVYDTEIKITEEAVNNSSAKLIPENCVIVAMYGATAGKSCINKIPLTTNQACCNLQINSNIALYKYVYYYVCKEYKNIKDMGEGSQNNINGQKVKSYPIPIPPLPKQQRIIRTLDTFESLLTNLKKERELRQKQYEYYREKLLTFA